MDQLGVINSALLKCGLPLAAALGDCDWNASLVYDQAAEEVLRSFAWGFATNFESLAKTTTPQHGFTCGYRLPAACLRVIDVHSHFDLRSPKARYTVRGREIYTNVSPCNVRYVARLLDAEDWPPDFADAVASLIAVKIMALSGQTMQAVPQLMQLYQLALANAQATDARENSERVPLDYNILAARAGAGERRGK